MSLLVALELFWLQKVSVAHTVRATGTLAALAETVGFSVE